ncbi:MAG: MarR family transcriptional regulator [Firmicutes bacterium]|nr:MarR family transcriptional regulator [Bacillota bacterium]
MTNISPQNDYPRIITDLLHNVKRSFEKLVKWYFNDYKLTLTQLSLVLLLKENGSLNVSSISKQMGLSKSTVSGIINRLEKMNIVTRTRSEEDRRVIRISLTDEVKNVCPSIENKLKEFIYHMFDGVSDDDLSDIVKGLCLLDQIIAENSVSN